MGILQSFGCGFGNMAGVNLSRKLFGDNRIEQKREEERLRIESEKELREHAAIERMADNIEERIQQLSTISIPQDRESLIELLNQLAYLLQVYKVHDNLNTKNKIRNRYADAILVKYEQVLTIFSSMYNNDILLDHFKHTLKSARKLRFIKKYPAILVIALGALTFIIYVVIAG